MDKLRKRILFIVLLVMFLVLGVVQASTDVDRFSNLRFLAMGSAGIASSEVESAFFSNPAALYRSEETQFKFGIRYGETIADQSGEPDPIPWIQQPSASVDLLFSNRFVSLSIGLGNILLREETPSGEVAPTDRELYTANNLSRIQLTGSYGWNSISFGFFASGGTMTERDVEIRSERPLFDYISRTYLERYDPVTDPGQLFSSGIGMLLSYPWISIGLISDSLFRIDENSNQLVLDLSDIFKGTAVGLAVTSPKFDRNNELNRLVVDAVFDFVDLGDGDRRSVRMGLETKVQFLTNLWIALRGGYQERRPVDESLFSLSGNGEVTGGLGGQLGDMGIDITVAVPLSEESLRITTAFRWKL